MAVIGGNKRKCDIRILLFFSFPIFVLRRLIILLDIVAKVYIDVARCSHPIL